MSDLKRRKSENTKRFIIEQTASLFNKKGYAATSISDITSSTGLTKGSIYGNFLNKDEISTEVFLFNLEKLYNPLKELVDSRPTYLEKLYAYPQFFRASYKEIFELGGCAILNTATEVDDTHPELKKLVNTAIKNWQKQLTNIIKKAIQEASFNPKADPAGLANLFISLLEGSIMLSKTTGERKFLFTAIDHLEKLIEENTINQ